ncbi:CENP-Q, a CENPA-CAD centromere complex subunit-domain-containing protein [Podospora australis]|uniref:CENP-Q, a CENPA-CAD centromere complex subunit-domain-containing protein n=1 Tax=Podospora australis TaxID=1536484 RepID=A0AAN6X1S6_9PEZI|nr:CENP-Q, a CENPA-CAD centromere complex subunit-domain-containing protein [Podospora australis]
MAKDQPNQKRKRGRPGVASKNTKTASESDPKEALEKPTVEDHGLAETATKKPGRPRKNANSVNEEHSSVAQARQPEPAELDITTEEAVPKKRGRRPKNQDVEPDSVNEEGFSEARAQEPEPAEIDSFTEEAAPKKRGRRPKNQDVEPEATEEVEKADNAAENTDPAPKKKAGRTRRVRDEETQPEEEAPEQAQTAPEVAIAKRRGRKPKTTPTEHGTNEEDQPAEEAPEPAPKKRGQRAKAKDTERETEEEPSENVEAAQEAEPKKRGRSAKTSRTEPEPEEETSLTENAPSTAIVPRKRGRSARTNEAELEGTEPTEKRPRKRARADEAVEESQEQAEQIGRGRGRKKATDAQPEDQQTAELTSRQRRRGRWSKDDEPVEETTTGDGDSSDTSGRRNGKGRRVATDNAEEAPETSTEVTRTEKAQNKSQTKRGRATLAEVSVSKVQNNQNNDQRPENPQKRGANSKEKEQEAPSRRRSSPEPSQPEAEKAPADPLAKAKYQHLAQRTRHVPRSVIASKWTPLDSAAINTIDALVRDAYIPVLERLANRDAKYAQAQTILRTFTNRLHSKLVKGMPFPPATTGLPGTSGKGGVSARELELNFEKVIDTSAQLQKQLDPLLHSVALLESEKEGEERKLQAEYKALRELESNAKAEARSWRERGKRSHALAPERRDVDIPSEARLDEDILMSGIEVVTAKKGALPKVNVFKDVVLGGKTHEGREAELLDLAKQIGSHMESMKGNLGQIEGVVPAIQKGKAALQGVLARHLSEEAYESVVLG